MPIPDANKMLQEDRSAKLCAQELSECSGRALDSMSLQPHRLGRFCGWAKVSPARLQDHCGDVLPTRDDPLYPLQTSVCCETLCRR